MSTFDFTKEPMILKSLANSGLRFFKFSQSGRNDRASAEKFYTAYTPNEITHASERKGLSFVIGANLGSCFMYGDQVTEFSFDMSNDKFAAISMDPYKCVGSSLGELEANRLLVKENYSLQDPQTIRTIIMLSDEDSVWSFLNFDSLGGTMESRLRQFGFIDSLKFFEHLKKNYDTYSMAEIRSLKEYCHDYDWM